MSKMANVTFAVGALRNFNGNAKFTAKVNVRSLTGTQIMVDGRVKGNSWDQNYARGVFYVQGNQVKCLYSGTHVIKVDNVATNILTLGRHTIELTITGASYNSFVNIMLSNSIENFAGECLKGITLEELQIEVADFPEQNLHHKFAVINETNPGTGMFRLPNLAPQAVDKQGGTPLATAGWTNANGTWTKTSSAADKLFLDGNGDVMDTGLVEVSFDASNVNGHTVSFVDVRNTTTNVPIINGQNSMTLICGRNHSTYRVHVAGTNPGVQISNIRIVYPRKYCLLRIANAGDWV